MLLLPLLLSAPCFFLSSVLTTDGHSSAGECGRGGRGGCGRGFRIQWQRSDPAPAIKLRSAPAQASELDPGTGAGGAGGLGGVLALARLGAAATCSHALGMGSGGKLPRWIWERRIGPIWAWVWRCAQGMRRRCRSVRGDWGVRRILII
jgi:hypothetical protein